MLLQALLSTLVQVPAPPMADAPAGQDEAAARFAALVRRECLECHGAAGTRKGGLGLFDRAGALAGGHSGPAVDLAAAEESALVTAIGYEDELLQMPPTGRLSESDRAVVLEWIRAGAPEFGPLAEVSEPAPEPAPRDRIVQPDGLDGWAYRPLTTPVSAPDVRAGRAAAAATIDAFLDRALEARGIDPAPRAPGRVLVRRLHQLLTGLPPTPEAVDAYLADPSPTRFEARAQELLASPHYGERFGRHWLDVVRYADTNGFERDADKPHIWRYRDWVIDAFNRDLPYPRFVLEQLAGDEVAASLEDEAARARALVASGFLRLMQWDDEPGAGELQGRFDVLDDIASTAAQAFLGTTMGCARCHDHKADPISQRDYASFVGLFNGLTDMQAEGALVDITSPEERARLAPLLAEISQAREDLDGRVRAMRERFLERLKSGAIRGGERYAEIAVESPDRFEEMFALHGEAMLGRGARVEWASLKEEREALDARTPERSWAFAAQSVEGAPPPMHVHARGNASLPAEQVQPGAPAALFPSDTAPGVSSRSELARWIASPDNALSARVAVNRAWQWHFGRGLVPTANDFGELGARPSHPELLDWLAAYFVASGGSFKELSLTLLSTRAWQRASTHDDAAFELDPENALLWRHSPRRMAAEEVRDALLFVSGELSDERGGPPVFGRMPMAALLTASRPAEAWGSSTEEERNRRTIYLKVKRSLLPPFLVAHDMADVDATCPERFTTVLPTQALQMLNGAFVQEMAAALAARVAREVPGDAGVPPRASLERRIRRAVRLTLLRDPAPDELLELVELHGELAEEFAQGPSAEGPALAPLRAPTRSRGGAATPEPATPHAGPEAPAAGRPLELVCLTLLCANEFVFLD